MFVYHHEYTLRRAVVSGLVVVVCISMTTAPVVVREGVVSMEMNIPETPRHPVILVPGDGGSQIEGKLTGKPSSPHYWCSKKTSSWYLLWLNLENMLPFVTACFVDDFRLVYNESAAPENRIHSPEGVETRVPGWGDTETVEFFDSSHLKQSRYYNDVVARLLKELGYKKNVSVRGAPYDFRRSPADSPSLLTNLATLVEDTFSLNGDRPVVIVGHSLGNLIVLSMLQSKSAAWKKKFVRCYFAISPPLAGAVKPIRLLTSGDTLSIPVQSANEIRTAQRSFPSSVYLLPYKPFWKEDELLVLTEKKNYTINDYEELFSDINFPEGWSLRKWTSSVHHPEIAPEVEVHCLYGVNLSTPAAFSWTGKMQFPDSVPHTISGDGDGTVNIRSLRLCQSWSVKQKEKVFHKEIDKAEHLEILHDESFLRYITYFLKYDKPPL